jgi:hypothetical protein
VQILTAGRPLPKPEERKEERRTISMEELETLIEESRKSEGGEGIPQEPTAKNSG